jgi:hypothetical protein
MQTIIYYLHYWIPERIEAEKREMGQLKVIPRKSGRMMSPPPPLDLFAPCKPPEKKKGR